MDIWIDRTEAAWLNPLYRQAEQTFKGRPLPSHDHTHHMRVWNLCKTILREIATFNSRSDPSLVAGVIIAAFFHDLGMAFSTREDHGRLGSELCRSWFMNSGREHPERFEEILQAIELHDRKDVQLYTAFSRDDPPEILGILTVADDLEALGVIGVYRYAEIYLKRGITLKELGNRILENVKIRFENLSAGCHLCSRLVKRYRLEYNELCFFFEQYNKQLTGIANPDRIFTGPLGVINYIRRYGIHIPQDEGARNELTDFFMKLENELDHARL